MSKIVLNQAQKTFLQSSGKDILLSAGAGSGKTTTMIEKIVHIICEEHVSLNNLMIVTYTNASAAEMKQKLYFALVDRLNNTTDDLADFLNQQLDNMNTCEIGTLHAICKKLVTKYFYVIEQDASFGLVNEKEQKFLFANACQNIFKKHIVKNDIEFFELYEGYNKKRNTVKLQGVIENLYKFLVSKSDAVDWKSKILANSYNSNFKENTCANFLMEYAKSIFDDIDRNFKIYSSSFYNVSEKVKKYFENCQNFLLQVKHINDYYTMTKFLQEYIFVTKPGKGLSIDEKELFDQMEYLIKDFKETRDEFKKIFQPISNDELENVKKLLVTLFTILDEIKNEYDTLKYSRNLLDFNDLEHKTLEILKNKLILKELKEKYAYIFIDEYQDISEIQEDIIKQLKNNGNLNMIGDVKQSIYEFRRSNPKLFIEKYYSLPKHNGQVINLNENYRSENNILQFVNFIFNKIMTKKTLGIDYKSTSQLIQGGTHKYSQVVSLNIIDSTKDDESEKLDKDRCEAYLIAQKVKSILTQSYELNGKKEKYTYNDIAILLRSRTQLMQEVFKALQSFNIPCAASFKKQIFKSNEIIVLFSILEVLNNHHNDIALVCVMKNMFQFNENEMAKIRLISDDKNYYKCVTNYLQNGDDQKIKEKIQNLFKFIYEHRFKLTYQKVNDVLNNICEEYDLINHYASMPDGIEKLSNIKEFMNLLNNENYSYNLAKCVEYISEIQQGEIDQNISGAQDCVKIMSIHTSKGLEFPAVIIGGMGKSFIINKDTNNIVINDDFGVGIKYLNSSKRIEKDTFIRNACKLKNRKSEKDEEMRLLYVALTRAKNLLCCVGTYNLKNIEVSKNKGVYSSNNYLDYIFKCLSNLDLANFKNTNSFLLNQGESSEVNVNIYKPTEINQLTIDRSKPLLMGGSKELANNLQKYYAYSYPYKFAKNIALKNTVSSILSEESDYENLVYTPIKLYLNEGKVEQNSLLLGSAYHEIMRDLNYTEGKDDILKLVEKLKLNSTFSEVANDVNIDKILLAVNQVNKLIEKGDKLLKEAQFTMKDSHKNLIADGEDVDVIVQGAIDLVIIKNQRAIIIDFKSNKVKNQLDLVNAYSLQLSLYSKAFEKAYNIPVSQSLLYSFELNKFISIV